MEGFSTILRLEYGSQLDSTSQNYLMLIASAAERLDRFIQDFIIWFMIALGASHLATSNSPIRWLGLIAFALIALNLSSALLLRAIQGVVSQNATETS